MPTLATTALSEGGHVVVPPEVRRQLQLRDGDVVCFELIDGEVRLMNKAQHLQRVRDDFLKKVPKQPGRAGSDGGSRLVAHRERG
jgi:bifunctional DNA-binding transcriptional regulator/antitoxin component of YhaV-PrlF toxin-antitoxin module